MTDHLCDDVLINILKYLDLKSLLNCRAVSQQWARCVDKRCKVIKTLSTRKWPNEADYNGHIWDEWHFWLETTGYKRDMILVNELFNVQHTYFELNSAVFYRFLPLYRLCHCIVSAKMSLALTCMECVFDEFQFSHKWLCNVPI